MVDLSKYARAPQRDTGSVDLAGFTQGATFEPAPVTGGEFERGVQRGAAQFNQMFNGMIDLAGSAIGSESLRNYAQENIQIEEERIERLLSDVPTLGDIESGADFFDWAAGKIGEQVPLMAGLFTTGGAGAIGATVAKTALRNSIQRGLRNRATQMMQLGGTVNQRALRSIVDQQMSRPAVQQRLANALTAQQGATRAVGGFSMGINAGDIQNELMEAGIDAPLTAALGGVAAGALDAAPIGLMLDRMFPNLDREISKGLVSDFANALGMQAVLEGPTEALQEMVVLTAHSMHDPSFNPLSEANQARILEAFAAGALVGGVTGGAGQAIVSIPRAGRQTIVDNKNRIQNFVRARTQAETAQVDEEADSLVPGIGEMRAQASKYFDEQVSPMMNTIRDGVANGVNQVRASLGTRALGVDFERMVTDVESTLQQRVGPAVGEMLRSINERITTVREAALDMVGEEREAFLTDQFNKIRTQVDEFVEGRVKPAVRRAREDFENRAKGRAYDDDEIFEDTPDETQFIEEADRRAARDETESITPEDLTRIRFGRIRREIRTATATNDDGTKRTISERINRRTRDDDLDPYPDRDRAEQGIGEIRAHFPHIPEHAFGIEEVEGGFAVAVRDEGAAEAIREQTEVVDQAEEARISSRMNKDKTRRIRLRRAGSKSFTNFDAPSLAFAGINVMERGGVAIPENRARAATQGLDTMIGRMLDAGYELENPNALRTVKLTGLSAGEARRIAQRALPAHPEVLKAHRELNRAIRALNAVLIKVDNIGKRANIPQGLSNELSRAEQAVAEAERKVEAAEEQYGKLLNRDELLDEDFEPTRERDNIPQFDREAPPQDVGVERLTEQTTERGVQFGRATFGETAPDQGQIVDRPNYALGVTESEAAINESSKRMKGPRRKLRSERMQEMAQWHRNTQQNVRVALDNQTEAFQQSLHDLVTELADIAGLRNRFLIVDAVGAQALIEAGHPASDSLIWAQQHDPKAWITRRGGDAVIYLSPQMTQGKVASANTAVAIGHEIGHVVRDVYFDSLSPQLQQRLRDEFEKSGFKAKNPDNVGRPDADFDEWMADRFVAWATSRVAPRNAVERFFNEVGVIIRGVWQRIRDKFPAGETYNEFMDGVVSARAGEQSTNEFTQHFLNEGVAGYKHWEIPQNANFDTDQLQDVKANVKAQILRKLDKYPGAKMAGTKLWETLTWFHDNVISSLNGALRAPNIPAMNRLADTLNRTPGQATDTTTYFNSLDFHRALFSEQFNKILDNMSDAKKQEVVQQLIDGTPVSNEANAILNVFQQMYDYMTEAGLPVDRIENYFPRIWDVDKLKEPHNFEAVIKRLEEKHGFDRATAESIADNMVRTGEEVQMQENVQDDVPFEGFLEKRAEIFNDRWFNEFQSTDIDRTVERYLNAAVKRAEFNRFYGSDSEGTRDGWNPRGKLEEMLEQAKEQGADQQQLNLMVKAVDAALGRHGREIPDSARQTMAWVTTYQNVRLLLFATLASFPDIVGPTIRSGDFKESFRTLKRNYKELVDKESDLHQMARTWGIISDTLNRHILTEQFDNHWFPERARRINEKFFKAIGLEWWTNFTRAAALAVGRDSIKRWAADGNIEMLAELGLSVEDVQSWIDRGEPTFGAAGFDAANTGDRKVAQALVTFVNESIMRPNPSQRPLWASNPAFMLLFHLKSFMYSFHDTVGRRLYHNFKQANTPWEKAMVVAMPALAMMALTAIGLELRELIQYKLWGRKARTDRMDADEYIWELAQRSGIFGVSQLALDWEGADERGQLPFMAVAGPSINQLNDFVSRPISQTGPKAIPIIGQIPPARDIVRDFTPL